MKSTDYRILVVDDDELVVQVAQQLLDPLPYTVISTTVPSKAIQILTMWEIAVLLCDLNMPEIDGIEVLARARQANPDIVSILITGIADQEATVRAINEGGIWKFIAKPWRSEELVNLVEQAVERYSTYHRPHAKLVSLARNLTARMQAGEGGRPKSKPFVVLKKGRERKGHKLGDISEEMADGRYRLVEVVGEGGSGTVYKAEDLLLGMPVAIKIVSPSLAHDQIAVSALKEEARIAMQLSHRHIVRLHNLQTMGGKYCLVMEYVEGRTFRQILDMCGALPKDSVAQVVEVCAEALSHAHRHGIVHKDLKPENLLLTDDGVLKIIDFGIAAVINVRPLDGPIMGTPAYMSPEQIRGEILDARTDVYSFGMIVYELLRGRSYYRKNTSPVDIINEGQVRLLGLPPEILDILMKAVAFDREERWKSVEDFGNAFLDVAKARE